MKVDKLYRDAMAFYFGFGEDALSHERINKEKFSANKVAYVMEKLESISVTENKYEDDVLGAFFESIVRTGFKQEKGQFFTHTNIVRFVLHALELDLDIIERVNSNSPTIPHIIDPSCGSGTFIIEAMKLITQAVVHPQPGASSIAKSRRAQDFVQEWFQPKAENHNIQNRWARQFIYGIEDNGDLALATKVNMILHGDGNANIFKADGLAAFTRYEPTKDNLNTRLQNEQTPEERKNQPYKLPCNEQFDVVVGNERMNSRFAWYFFRSVMFQSQISRELRGSSVSNIFPPQVEQMFIVSCSRTKQDDLARDIAVELKRRTDALAAIEENRKQIHALIEEAIQS